MFVQDSHVDMSIRARLLFSFISSIFYEICFFIIFFFLLFSLLRRDLSGVNKKRSPLSLTTPRIRLLTSTLIPLWWTVLRNRFALPGLTTNRSPSPLSPFKMNSITWSSFWLRRGRRLRRRKPSRLVQLPFVNNSTTSVHEVNKDLQGANSDSDTEDQPVTQSQIANLFSSSLQSVVSSFLLHFLILPRSEYWFFSLVFCFFLNNDLVLILFLFSLSVTI